MSSTSTKGGSLAILSPDKELAFQRPFSSVVKRTLTVTNTHSSAIAFKVKTTAPKQYCVRPNSAVVPRGQSLDVQVLLQAMKDDPPAGHISKDKFLVQCIAIPDEEVLGAGDEAGVTQRLAGLWAQAEQRHKAGGAADNSIPLMEKKLRCIFLPAEIATSPANSAPSETATLASSTARSISNNADSPVRQEHSAAAFSDASQNSTSSATAPGLIPANTSTFGSAHDALDSTPSALGSASTQAIEKELREAREKTRTLQAACDGYKAEIERLLLVRQRRGGDVSSGGPPSPTSSTAGSLALQQQPHTGLPMTVGAGIAVVAFLIGAYIF
ncbi:phosphatidylinositol-binding protein scs2 [Thoreauomyces humboldtii]|nr:phosphatidylinositol-binding protein scs2 [Thoreauomyces humboldtii]